MCVSVSMCISNCIVHFNDEKREADSTTTTDLDETISVTVIQSLHLYIMNNHWIMNNSTSNLSPFALNSVFVH